MVKTIEELKELRPELVQEFESMNRETLLNQIYLEVIDALNMEERVQTFMEECTTMSYTTYTPEVIKQLVQDKYERDISDFCEMTLEDTEDMSLEETRQYLRDEVIDIKFGA
jgi:hypothetical protein